jgi:hypothetical protein
MDDWSRSRPNVRANEVRISNRFKARFRIRLEVLFEVRLEVLFEVHLEGEFDRSFEVSSVCRVDSRPQNRRRKFNKREVEWFEDFHCATERERCFQRLNRDEARPQWRDVAPRISRRRWNHRWPSLEVGRRAERRRRD